MRYLLIVWWAASVAMVAPSAAAEATRHWAFSPVSTPVVPAVRNPAWPQQTLDHFVLQKLEAHSLSPAPTADKPTLLRRVTFDLTGLPPTAEHLEAFVSDTGRDAWPRVIDRLLDSPEFGEHWGRHWLDVVRYADSNGTEFNRPYPNAWRYRDYVIRAWNEDRGFDQFIREQLAGDLLPAKDDAARINQITATGFLALGPKALFEPSTNKLLMDIVDEQIDVTTRSFLGLTVSCARCHDHKYDPIPTRDYYALAGIFRSTATLASSGSTQNNPIRTPWIERPLTDAATALAIEQHEATMARLDRERAQAEELRRSFPGQINSARLAGIVVDNPSAERIGTWKESTGSTNFVDRDYLGDGNADKGKKSLRYVPALPRSGRYEVLFSYPPYWNRATNVPVTVEHADGATTLRLDQTRKPSIDHIFVALGTFRFEARSNAAVVVSNRGTKGFVVADAVRFVPVAPTGDPSVESMAMAPSMRPAAMSAAAVPLMSSEDLDALDARLIRLRTNAPPAVPMAMSVQEAMPLDCPVNLRGDPDRLGDQVPRGFISCLHHPELARIQIPSESSGRKELADWIAHPDNPLTTRVMVNRVWQHLFGRGLVDSPDNFGRSGEPPTHPELLDHLARQFIASKWSLKSLIRQCVLSRTYQMSSTHHAAAAARDPDNRLLWRMHRKRLPAESLRDAMLSVSGQLDRTRGGSVVSTNAAFAEATMTVSFDEERRRSVYLPILRNNLPDFLQAFDFPDPHFVSGQRHTTVAPTQALYLLNSPFVLAQSRRWAESLLPGAADVPAQGIATAYRRGLGRDPTPVETAWALAFLAPNPLASAEDAVRSEDTLARWAQLCQALLASTPFRYLD